MNEQTQANTKVLIKENLPIIKLLYPNVIGRHKYKYLACCFQFRTKLEIK